MRLTHLLRRVHLLIAFRTRCNASVWMHSDGGLRTRCVALRYDADRQQCSQESSQAQLRRHVTLRAHIVPPVRGSLLTPIHDLFLDTFPSLWHFQTAKADILCRKDCTRIIKTSTSSTKRTVDDGWRCFRNTRIRHAQVSARPELQQSFFKSIACPYGPHFSLFLSRRFDMCTVCRTRRADVSHHGRRDERSHRSGHLSRRTRRLRSRRRH